MDKPCETCFVGYHGSRVTKIICARKGHPAHKRPVTPEMCEKCLAGTPPETPQEPHIVSLTINPLGTLTYARTGWEPPPVPPGYQRKSSDLNSDAAWILDPLKPVCKHLELSPANVGPCGYPRIAHYCLKIKSFVGPRTCESCRLREETDAP
jgi:hypothetical protein